MPIHDWTRVSDGTFHDFHVVWLGEIRTALNDGLLPPSYYAQAEQIIGAMGPDVLTLQTDPTASNGATDAATGSGGVAVAVAPPLPRLVGETEMAGYLPRRRAVVVRHVSGDRVVALVEIVSPGNKSSRNGLATFVDKAREALYRGYHLLIVDLFPPTKRDPQGIHGAIFADWADDFEDAYVLPPDAPLTLAAYSAGPVKRVYVEQTAVGRELIDMPLFLTPDTYVNVPLEATYQAAYRGVPRRWKQVLEAD